MKIIEKNLALELHAEGELLPSPGIWFKTFLK